MSKLFDQKVGGTVRARLQLKDGVPSFEDSWDEFGKPVREYDITLTLEAANANIDNVTYELLHDTYEGPEPESSKVNSNFRVRITSYGDFPIKIVATTISGRAFAKRGQLSDLLKSGHPDWEKEARIRDAIRDIEGN